MKGTRSVYSLQFLDKNWQTDPSLNRWVTHCQTDTEAQAWELLAQMEQQYSSKHWRWILGLEDSGLHFMRTESVACLTKVSSLVTPG